MTYHFGFTPFCQSSNLKDKYPREQLFNNILSGQGILIDGIEWTYYRLVWFGPNEGLTLTYTVLISRFVDIII